MNWKGKKVLVTGSGGFIGSHLCEKLIELGADVTAMIHYSSRGDWANLEFLPFEMKKELKIISGNIEDSDFMMKHINGKETIFHLAALISIPYSYEAPLSFVRTNVEGTLNVLEASRRYHVEKIIHTSTSETYGTAIYTPIDEKHPLQGQSPYSATKIAADKLVESYFRSFELPVVTVRPFNTFGPRQSARAIIPAIISQAFFKDKIRLGSLEPIRDLNYVKDVVKGFIKAAESENSTGEVINIGFGKGISIGELVKLILSVMNIKKSIQVEEKRIRPDRSEVYILICDNTKAKELIGWTPQYSLRKGLEEVIEFIRRNTNIFKPDIYLI